MTIKIDNISKVYKKKYVLNNISIELEEGDILGVVGSNGAGKSTLLSILSTLLSLTDGEINYDLGTNNLKELRKHIAYIPQDIALFEEMTVKENLKIFNTENKNNDDIVNEVIDVMQLSEYYSEKIKKLSGGTKRRINMAMSLVKDAKIILMDEPVVGVEYFIRKDIENYLKELASRGKIIIMTSHMKEFLDKTCNKLLILNKGNLEYFGDYNEDMEYFK